MFNDNPEKRGSTASALARSAAVRVLFAPYRTSSTAGPLKDAQRRIDEWISQFEEGYWPPLVNLTRLMEEVGELARLVNHRFGTKPKKSDESEQEMAEELADVLFVILCMANEQGIDLEQAFDKVMEKYRTRDGKRWTRRAE